MPTLFNTEAEDPIREIFWRVLKWMAGIAVVLVLALLAVAHAGMRIEFARTSAPLIQIAAREACERGRISRKQLDRIQLDCLAIGPGERKDCLMQMNCEPANRDLCDADLRRAGIEAPPEP